jgi:hypothetical protein
LNRTTFGRSGRYDRATGGKKSFGNPTQGNSSLSLRDSSNEVLCKSRELYLVITALSDFGFTSLNIDITVNEFDKQKSLS